MKRFVKFWLMCVALVAGSSTYAATLRADSLGGGDIFEIEKKGIVQRLGFEKVRIVNDYHSVDVNFLNLVDSVTQYIVNLDVPRERRNIYLQRLQFFLQNIDRYYSDSYLKNGTYLAVLSYYPIMIEWDLKDELGRNIKRYSAFSIKATRLIPNDTIAEDFLTDYMKDYPDDIFRYAEEFDDRRFTQRLLEKALKRAPESAKRYYSTGNVVNDALRSSQDKYVKKTYEIYNRYGIKSHAYLLVDDIVNSRTTIEAADSAGIMPDKLFSMIVQRGMRVNSNINYSMYRFVDNYSVDVMRKLNQEALNSNYQFDVFRKCTPEEMFVLLSYGYNQTTTRTFQTLLDILKKRCDNVLLSSTLINTLDKNKLKELIVYCDKNQLLDNVLALVDDERKDYLLELTTIEDEENLIPPFKSFSKENAIAQKEPEYRVMNDVAQARPPKPVVNDKILEEKTIIQPERQTPEPAGKPTAVATETPVIRAPAGAKPLITDDATKADAVPTPPPPPAEIVEPIKIVLDDKVRAVIMLKKNIINTIQNIPAFIDKDYAEEVLMYAAQKEPDEMLKKVEMYKRKFYSKKILEQCAINAPVSVKRYLYNPNHPVNYILQYSADPVIKKIFEINQQIGYHSKPMLLLDDIVSGTMTVKDAITISSQPDNLFNEMVKIISRPKYIGQYSIDHEIRDYSLRFVREINDKIASGAAQPFYAVEDFNAQQLYFLMLYGRDEVFTSTFNGLFNRFMLKLPGGNGDMFLKAINNAKFRDFISLCANYGVLEEFLAKLNATAKQELLATYISGLEKEKDNLSSIVLVAEALSNLTDKQLLISLQKNIKFEYERVTVKDDKIGISIYGILSSIISSNIQTDEGWYHHISQQFQVSPVGSLLSSSMFNTSGMCIEQMYFYNDDDGRSSFINFMNTYRSQAAWSIEDKYNYVRIYSTGDKDVEIFANKPEYDDNGINAINSYFKERNLSPSVIVHRGHSFHTEATLEKVPESAKLIFVGSCGGFYKISIALENAPEAHIISTKQVGTKSVNDAMIYALNENIRQGKDIVWNEFWDKMREKLQNNKYFSDYIPPNKNLESTFIRAYYKILGV